MHPNYPSAYHHFLLSFLLEKSYKSCLFSNQVNVWKVQRILIIKHRGRCGVRRREKEEREKGN